MFAEEPLAFGEIYMLKYFQNYIYFILFYNSISRK
jgi:hypothetical protein